MAISFCSNALSVLLHEKQTKKGDFVYDDQVSKRRVGGVLLLDTLYLSKLIVNEMMAKLRVVISPAAYAISPGSVYVENKFPQIQDGKQFHAVLLELFATKLSDLNLYELGIYKQKNVQNYDVAFNILSSIKGYFVGKGETPDGKLVDAEMPEKIWYDIIFKNTDISAFPWSEIKNGAMNILYEDLGDWQKVVTREDFKEYVKKAQEAFHATPIDIINEVHGITSKVEPQATKQ